MEQTQSSLKNASKKLGVLFKVTPEVDPFLAHVSAPRSNTFFFERGFCLAAQTTATSDAKCTFDSNAWTALTHNLSLSLSSVFRCFMPPLCRAQKTRGSWKSLCLIMLLIIGLIVVLLMALNVI